MSTCEIGGVWIYTSGFGCNSAGQLAKIIKGHTGGLSNVTKRIWNRTISVRSLITPAEKYHSEKENYAEYS